jgi:hypothetical protein
MTCWSATPVSDHDPGGVLAFSAPPGQARADAVSSCAGGMYPLSGDAAQQGRHRLQAYNGQLFSTV